MPPINETIFALASAAGRAGVAVLRVSGPQSKNALLGLTGEMIEPRRATLRLLRDPTTTEPIDRVLLLWFPAPQSFTGEDVLEIHAHGSHAVIARFLEVLGGFENFRLAEPGEFARRAFESGKMDLTAIEGLADLINSETEGQRQQALRQSEGQLGRLYESWRGKILSASALIEAGIDFSDEEDISNDLGEQALAIAVGLRNSIAQHLEISGRRGEQMRDGFRLVIGGAPNVGKSTLLNALADREAAIVTSEPGTTRDIVEVQLNIAGFPVLIMDTAGIRQTSDKVELEGIRRAIERLKQADLVLWLVDPAQKAEDRSVFRLLEKNDHPATVWRILSKADLLQKSDLKRPADIDLAISAHSHEGMSDLMSRIEALLVADEVQLNSPLITRARHREEILTAQSALSEFISGPIDDSELRAEDLRQAALALGRLTGRIDVEELLGQIFGEFCIGK